MTDEELIKRLRDAPADGLGTENLCIAAADRIEALVKADRAQVEVAEKQAETIIRINARAERLEAVLRELIDHTHNCEKELTERLYRADFCGESLPLTNARAALRGADHA